MEKLTRPSPSPPHGPSVSSSFQAISLLAWTLRKKTNGPWEREEKVLGLDHQSFTNNRDPGEGRPDNVLEVVLGLEAKGVLGVID